MRRENKTARWVGSCAGLLILCQSVASHAVQNRRIECQSDASCAIGIVEKYLNQKQAREAIEFLKPFVQKNPADGVLSRLLARAYLADANPFWAIQVLQQSLAQKDDCETRAWLAWLYLDQGSLEQAEELLGRPGCPLRESDQARHLLLESFLHRLKGDPAAALAKLEQAWKMPSIYQEDLEWLKALRMAQDPEWEIPWVSRLDFSFGYTSNAVAAAPLDASFTGPQSLLGRMELDSRLILPFWQKAKPSLQLTLLGHGLPDRDAKNYSFLQVSARPGVTLARNVLGFRLILFYKLDLSWLEQNNRGPYFTAHRGEVELEAGPLAVFAGAGLRTFLDSSRDRVEIDGGVGGSLRLWPGGRLLLAGLLRYNKSSDPYSLVGASAMSSLQMEVGHGCQVFVGADVDVDYYPHSGGSLGREVFGTITKRVDLLPRFSATLWGPDWDGLQLGGGYALTWRDTSADTPIKNFDFQEHRLLVRLRWTWDADFWAPSVASAADHVRLDRDSKAEPASRSEERIQEWIRQDQAERRGACGCGH